MCYLYLLRIGQTVVSLPDEAGLWYLYLMNLIETGLRYLLPDEAGVSPPDATGLSYLYLMRPECGIST